MDKDKIINALSIDYLNVFEIEVEKNMANVIKFDGYNFGDLEAGQTKINYEENLQLYAKKRVHANEYDEFLEKLNCQNLLKVFETTNKFEYTYLIYDNYEEHNYVATYIKLSSKNEPLVVIAGFRCIDNYIDSQKLKVEEGIKKAYDTISSIYSCMYRINVKNRRFTEIKTTENIKKLGFKNEGNFEEFIIKMIPSTCDLKYIDTLLDILDINKFESRFQNYSCVTHEFLSKNSGWCRLRLIREENDINKFTNVILTIEIIDDTVRRTERLNQVAQTDYLTGLLNKTYGEKYVMSRINNQEPGVLILIDIDEFNKLNAEYGREIADDIIKKISNSIFETTSERDILYRVGADEFSIYACGIISENDASKYINRIINSIKNIRIRNFEELKLSVSIGCAFNTNNRSYENLYKFADRALFEAKKVKNFKIIYIK